MGISNLRVFLMGLPAISQFIQAAAHHIFSGFNSTPGQFFRYLPKGQIRPEQHLPRVIACIVTCDLFYRFQQIGLQFFCRFPAASDLPYTFLCNILSPAFFNGFSAGRYRPGIQAKCFAYDFIPALSISF